MEILFIIAYAHIRVEKSREDSRKNRLKELLKKAFPNSNGSITFFRGIRFSHDFSEKLKDISAHKDGKLLPPVVWFIHLTPFMEEGISPATFFNDASGAVSRLHIVFVSGGGLRSDATYLQESIQAAKEKGFGGCAYWPHNIDDSDSQLVPALLRLNEYFKEGNQRSFEEFDKVINPGLNQHFLVEFPPEIHIIDQFLTQISEPDNPHFRQFRDKYNSDPSLLYQGLPEDSKWKLSEIIQNRAEFEQLRSRLRHHDLTNNFLLAAETIPSSDEALSQGLQDLKEKIQRYSDRDSIFKQLDDDIVKLCDLACSLKISALSSVIFPDLEVKRPDSILSWVDELKKTSNSLKEAASKIKALDDNSKPNDIRKAIKEFINSLKQSIEALKAPRSK
jgi:hypothetical protein